MFSTEKYNKLISYFEKNKDKKWNEWLVFDKILVPGKQGQVGLFSMKDDEDEKYIFKMSQTLNFLIYHELTIMQGLSELSNFCPHFCKGIGSFNCDVEPNRKSKNPFDVSSKYIIEKEVLLLEYIEKSSKFCNYINSEKVSEDIIFSIIKQTLMAINIAQKHKKFSHYDLHSNNIMIKKCNKNLVLVYKIDEDNQFCIPTYGYYPVIIDFGFSYIEDMDDKPLWTSLEHTDYGFMSDRFDWVADPKLFLITVSDEIKEKRVKFEMPCGETFFGDQYTFKEKFKRNHTRECTKCSKNSKETIIGPSKRAKCLRRIVRNIFFPLKIELDSGWDKDEDEKPAIAYVIDILETYKQSSRIFNTCEYYCLNLLQSLIILPLEEQNYKNIGKNFKLFIKEWIKIENEISNEFYNLYILKQIVNIARDVRPDFMDDETKEHAIVTFSKRMYDEVGKVAKFFRPKKIDFEVLLSSLYLLAQNIEGILYDVLEARMTEKQKEYSKMPLTNIEQIYASIDVNIPDTYKYNDKTVFLILDCVEKDHKIFEIPKNEINNINLLKNMFRGTYVCDLYNESLK